MREPADPSHTRAPLLRDRRFPQAPGSNLCCLLPSGGGKALPGLNPRFPAAAGRGFLRYLREGRQLSRPAGLSGAGPAPPVRNPPLSCVRLTARELDETSTVDRLHAAQGRRAPSSSGPERNALVSWIGFDCPQCHLKKSLPLLNSTETSGPYGHSSPFHQSVTLPSTSDARTQAGGAL